MGGQSESADPVLLEVGRIDKPHGVHGEVVVTLITHRTERLAPGAVLQTDRGTVTVESSRPHQRRHLVRFDRIADRDQAEDWRGVMLSAPPIDDDGTLWVHQLVGAVVVDQHGTQHSTVVALIENPASDLLELADGRLVPLVFVTAFQPGVRIEVDVPVGLLDDDLDVGSGLGAT